MTSLLLVPLDDTVVFPTMDVTLPVDAGDETRVLLVPRHEGEFAKVGTIAEVTDHVRLPGDATGDAGEGHGAAAAGEAHLVGDLGDRADLRELALVTRDEQDARLVARVHGQRHVHRGEDDGVVEGYEEQ